MIDYELLHDEMILIVTPRGPLQAADFHRLAQEVDPFIEEHGSLNGLMISTETFPGWDDFAALVSHLEFIRNHQRNIRKVAAVTDSGFLTIMPKIATHFVQAEVRHFDYRDRGAALQWLRGADD